jgi:hypothetical protein
MSIASFLANGTYGNVVHHVQALDDNEGRVANVEFARRRSQFRASRVSQFRVAPNALAPRRYLDFEGDDGMMRVGRSAKSRAYTGSDLNVELSALRTCDCETWSAKSV